jgi:alpha-ribazole phosphatase/probable phosphoglycerate mutase
MSEILFIRHAETDMAGTFCGHSDPPLNARGKVQLAELIERLRAENFGAIYTSDLRRAHDTGLALAEAFIVKCHVQPGLREIDFGRWEGLRWEDIEKLDETYARSWVAEYPHLSAPGGEDFGEFERRVLEEVNFLSLEAEIAARNIAVVTHAGVLRTILCSLQGWSRESAWEQTNSYCSVVRYAILPPASISCGQASGILNSSKVERSRSNFDETVELQGEAI